MADAQEFLKDFPLLHTEMNGRPIAYLDNGATTQKPEQVIKAICGYYGGCNANPHRGAYALSVKATEIYENARARTAKFINAARPEEIIFTKNATEALNLVAYSYGLHNVKVGDEIVISITEHHSNLVPWQHVACATGAALKYIYLEPDGNLSDEDIETKITERTKLVACTQVSNVLGLKNDVKKIAAKAHSVGAVCVVDGSQSVAHQKVDVQDIDADFFAFSGHKMCSMGGIGVLYGKEELLNDMEPFLMGGDMIEDVHEQETTYAELPAKFEAGTQYVEGAVSLVAAIRYVQAIGFDEIRAQEKRLVTRCLEGMKKLPFIHIIGPTDPEEKEGLVAFEVEGVHPHDVAHFPSAEGLYICTGPHGAKPLHICLGINTSCRHSLYCHNTEEEVDYFPEKLKYVRKETWYQDYGN